MKLAILKNESVHPKMADKYVDYDKMVVSWLKDFGFSEITTYNMVEQDSVDMNHDLFVSTGSRSSVYDDTPWIKYYESVVKKLHENRVNHFGICFGHQMIARVLGCEVSKAAGWGIGAHTWKIVGDNVEKKFDNPRNPDEFNLIVSHQDQVKNEVKGMNTFLKSDFCPIAGFTVGNHIMTVQGHPEFFPQFAKDLNELKKELYPQETYLMGQKSLEKLTDEVVLTDWIRNYFSL